MRRAFGLLLVVAFATTPTTRWAIAATPTAVPTAVKDKKECLAATNKGQDLRGEGKLRASREQFLVCARDVCPGALRTECTKWVAELDADTPSIVVRVTRDQTDVTDAKVTLDGEVITLDGKPIALDPGAHTVIAEAIGQKPVEQKLVLGTGEKNRSVTLVLPSDEPVVANAGPSLVPVAPVPAKSHGTPTFAYVAGGIGIVGLGTFAFFAATGVKDVNRLDRECAPRCNDDDVNAAKRKLLFADIGLGVGIVGLGLATYGFLSASSSSASTSGSSEKTSVSQGTPSLALLPGGGALAGFQGAF